MRTTWKTEGVWERADGKRFSRRLYTGPSRAEAMAVAETTHDYLFVDVGYDGPRGDQFYGRYRDGAWDGAESLRPKAQAVAPLDANGGQPASES